MAYTVLARRYRPEGFDSLVGQKNVSETLKNAIKMDRIGHAYLFTGPRGVGKTSSARIFAKALNCEKGTSPEPCITCPTCIGISKGVSQDVIEIDGASNNGVDDIREIRDSANYASLNAPYKIFIIDEVHMVTRAAFNALLKTLEEPPAHVIFLFATTEAHKIPETILSRCQRFDFLAISEKDIISRLSQILEQEKVKAEEGVLRAISRFADGGMRTAQSYLDQLITYSGGSEIKPEHLAEMFRILTDTELIELLEKASAGDLKFLAERAEIYASTGIQSDFVLGQLHQLLRSFLKIKHLGIKEERDNISENLIEKVKSLVEKQSAQGFMQALEIVQQGKLNISRGLDPSWALEMVLMNLGHLQDLPTLSSLMGMMVSPKKKTSAFSQVSN